jgi:hypothetical protein
MSSGALLFHPDVSRRLADWRSGFRRVEHYEIRRLFDQVNDELTSWRKQNAANNNRIIFLTGLAERAQVEALFREAFRGIPALSYEDLHEDISIQQVARISLAELPEACAQAREAIEIRDAEIDNEMDAELAKFPSPPDDGADELDRMTAGVIEMNRYASKLNARVTALRQADADDEILRDFLTSEVESFEAAMERHKFIENRNVDLTDFTSDWFQAFGAKSESYRTATSQTSNSIFLSQVRQEAIASCKLHWGGNYGRNKIFRAAGSDSRIAGRLITRVSGDHFLRRV